MATTAPTREASIALVLGAIAMVAIPLTFTWLGEPGTTPDSRPLATIAEFGALLAALGAFLFGRRARRLGDVSDAAVWGPRLGAAAILGFVLLVVSGGTPFA